ncbi:nuclear receptor ROR-beta-like [Oppia nitens]|uniref:nuclear receptor ROR-beta-like n=1 Tax=Oppia nitens TaxID=1686743 RepID=UPI0023D99D33|nr:nuclear receptor ROR-beta-like [Oppia nitens]
MIDEITRKFCSKCRIDKCLAIGMRRDWLTNDGQREWKRVKKDAKGLKLLEKNLNDLKNQRYNCNDKSNDNNYIDTNVLSDLSTDTSTESLIIRQDINDISEKDFIFEPQDNSVIQSEALLEIESIFGSNISQNTSSSQMSLHSSQPQSHQNQQQLDSEDTQYESIDISDDVIQKAIQFELTPIPIPKPLTPNKNELNDMEKYLLNELFDSFKSIGNYSERNRSVITSQISTPNEINCCMFFKIDKGVRIITSAAKRLSAFRNICQRDQISLLKYGCIESVFMRSVVYYNWSIDCWILPFDNENTIMINLENLRQFPTNVYNIVKNFMRKMYSIYDSDRYVIDLLLAIILFNPDHPNIVNKEIVKSQQHLYMYLLQRYLQIKLKSECEAKTRLLRLLNTLTDLSILREMQKQNFLNYNNEVTNDYPLIKEILLD